jgi:cyclophilin family peptidyl-prolyl cis-trans isomerase/HEAT repeat protein
MMKNTLILALAVCSFWSTLSAQKLSPGEREILRLQDERSLGDGKLVSYLQNKDRRLRFRAAIALANIQDTSTVGSLVPLLRDQDQRVRTATAFALGQIGSLSAEKFLADALLPDQDVTVLAKILEALGKCGSFRSLNTVVSYIPPARNIILKRDQAMGIARFAIRRITSERAVWYCFDLLNDNNAETRWSALFALWRSAPMGVIDLEISKRIYVLSRLMNDRNADVRINLATLLGRTKSKDVPELVSMFHEVESKAPDWRVQVQLARSMGSLVATHPNLLDKLITFLDVPNDHVKIAALLTLSALSKELIDSSLSKDRLLASLKALATMTTKEAVLVQGEAIVAIGKLYGEELAGVKAELDKKKASVVLESKYIEALSYQLTPETIRYVMDETRDDSVRVAMAAWDFLKRMIQPRVLQANMAESAFVATIPFLLVDRMSSALKKDDLAVTTLVANLFADTTIFRMCSDAGFGSRIVDELISAHGRLNSSNGSEAMQALQETFGRLRDLRAVPILEKSLLDDNRTVALGAAKVLFRMTGIDHSASILKKAPSHSSNYDWATLESIGSAQRVLFKTAKGSFVLRLRKDEAPFTVLMFVNLINERFYDGLIFHRVVPNFVVQGGDPRGDGWGGPGFTIRSEWSLLNFERGSVGIASSGKDTEGCQFFITHLPTPHLDGRYTVFATVSSGMDVIDRLQVGDRILSAEFRN